MLVKTKIEITKDDFISEIESGMGEDETVEMDVIAFYVGGTFEDVHVLDFNENIFHLLRDETKTYIRDLLFHRKSEMETEEQSRREYAKEIRSLARFESERDEKGT